MYEKILTCAKICFSRCCTKANFYILLLRIFVKQIMDKTFTLDRVVRLVISLLIIAAVFALTKELSSVLLPFVMAWFIAYLLHPIVNFFQYKVRLKNRALSVIVTLLVVFGLVAGLLAIIVPLIGREVAQMSSLVTEYVKGIRVDNILPEEYQQLVRNWLAESDISSLVQQLNISTMIEKAGGYLGGLIGGSLSAISSLFVVVVCLLYLVFILLDFEQISEGMRNMIPPKFRTGVNMVLTDLEQAMNKYFRGQALIATCVGVLFSIGFLIMGLPLAVVIGLLIGLFNMVPYLQVVGVPITMVLGLLQAADTGTSYWVILAEIAAVFVIVQAIQDLVLNPLIMGNVIGMNPAVMLLAISVWGYLLGIAGMIIALPLTTILISYYKRFILKEDNPQPVQQEVVTEQVPTPSQPTESK